MIYDIQAVNYGDLSFSQKLSRQFIFVVCKIYFVDTRNDCNKHYKYHYHLSPQMLQWYFYSCLPSVLLVTVLKQFMAILLRITNVTKGKIMC